MFEKRKLRKAIEASKKRIEEIEKKRSRSQAALVEAILTHTEPNDSDVEFFNNFTAQIDAERNHMHELIGQLEALEAAKGKGKKD